MSPGSPRDEFLQLYGIDDQGRIALQVWFDLEDMDAAIAEMDALQARFEDAPSRPRRQLQNRASRVAERFGAHIQASDWAAVAELIADGFSLDDRRRVVNAGIRYGRDAQIEDLRVVTDVGFTNLRSVLIATRGSRLALAHSHHSGHDPRPDAFQNDSLNLVEIDAGERIAAIVVYDVDDFDAAIAELDARYLAGEAAPYAHTWSMIAESYASLGRQEIPVTLSPGAMFVDHRRAAAFGLTDLTTYIRAGYDLGQQIRPYIEAVHRLTDLGAVCSYAAHGVSDQGFDAEWQGISLAMVHGDMFDHCEFFDEADLDAALARFDQLSQPAPRLENAASRVDERFTAHFAVRDWDAMAELTADDICIDDRRHVVNAGFRRGRDAEIANLRARAETGVETITSAVVAVRGERLALTRTRFWGHDQRPEDFHTVALCIIEIGTDERIVTRVGFDLEDFDSAMAELESRYIAGEAAAHARIWSVVAAGYAGFNRRELVATTPDWVNIDHRRGAAFAAGDMIAYLQAAWDDSPDTKIYIAAVHRLGEIGAVVTHVSRGISQEGFDAEWRDVHLLAVDDEMISRCELFDEDDLDAAIARFDQLSRPTARLENAASQLGDRFLAHFAAGDWDAMAEIFAEDMSNEDRRRLVSTGVFDGRDAQMANMRAVAELWSTNVTRTVMATRGRRLSLARVGFSRGEGVELFVTEFYSVIEIDTDERISAIIVFDVDDFDAAIAELDARYLAGEAAAHACTWSAIAEVYAAMNRGEMPTTASDLVDIDHRSLAAIGSGDLMAYLEAASEDSPEGGIYIETVHRLTGLGAVTTHVTKATSREGFDAEWRITSFFIVGGDLVNRYEIFDEDDLDAALARFEDLQPQARRLQNAVAERFLAHFAAHDWDALAQDFAENYYCDDRRRVVNAGLRQGRDAAIEDLRVSTELGLLNNATMDIIATRGERLVLTRWRGSGSDHDAFQHDALQVVEHDADERIATAVLFDVDDLDAAFEELDARYLAGEAAAHARTWSVVASSFAAFNRQELLAADWVTIDHRQTTPFEPSNMTPSIRNIWELTPNLTIHIEAVHRLNNFAAVITHEGHGTSLEGFDAEWRAVDILMVDGDSISRCEIFDEKDLDTALARFEDMHPQTPRLENAASQVTERFLRHFAVSDWDAMAEILADNFFNDDRRPLVSFGVHGRDAQIANMRAIAELLSTEGTSTVIATRAARLALVRLGFSVRGQGPDAFQIEALGVVEIDTEERIAAFVVFDTNDFQEATAELDARYLAGEAAAHARVWSTIMEMPAAIGRQEMFATTPDFVDIDHRSLAAIGPGDLTAYVTAALKDGAYSIYVEAVHQLSGLGAVVTLVSTGTSYEGFDGEWRMTDILAVTDDLISRCEIFDQADLDAALARFHELERSPQLLDNAATRTWARLMEAFNRRDLEGFLALNTSTVRYEDRRPVLRDEFVGAAAQRKAVQAMFEASGSVQMTAEPVATRGSRLALVHACFRDAAISDRPVTVEMMQIVEVEERGLLDYSVSFDADDIDAAFIELDARYLTGDAAEHAHTWTLLTHAYETLNRRQLPRTVADWVNIDHRRLAPVAAGDLGAYLSAAWDLSPQTGIRIEAVHRLSEIGAVVTHAIEETSRDGFDAELRSVAVCVFQGELLSRCELFDEAELDAALARFEELQPKPRRLANAAIRLSERLFASFAASEWDSIKEILADDFSQDDRRRMVGAGVRHGRDNEIADLRAIADLWSGDHEGTYLATRGERLDLMRLRFSLPVHGDEPFVTEMLGVGEINADGRVVAAIAFDLDDIDAAFAELDARYLAGEAAIHARTWSLVVDAFAAINTHELPARTPDWVNVDHRRGAAFAAGELTAYIEDLFDDVPDIHVYVEVVHRLGDLGAVITQVGHGTSRKGFQAEWREVALLTFDGDLLSRFELFDEADLDAALSRFEELQPQARRLENAASRVHTRLKNRIAARDWSALPEVLADDIAIDDRRRAVNSGIQYGRDAAIADMRAAIDLGLTQISLTVIAIRGARLELSSYVYFGRR